MENVKDDPGRRETDDTTHPPPEVERRVRNQEVLIREEIKMFARGESSHERLYINLGSHINAIRDELFYEWDYLSIEQILSETGTSIDKCFHSANGQAYLGKLLFKQIRQCIYDCKSNRARGIRRRIGSEERPVDALS